MIAERVLQVSWIVAESLDWTLAIIGAGSGHWDFNVDALEVYKKLTIERAIRDEGDKRWWVPINSDTAGCYPVSEPPFFL